MFKSLSEGFKLYNGVESPCIGFGTFQMPNTAVCETAVAEAIKAGYRHIDTAAIYGNEETCGSGIKKSGVKREELFITTKLWNDVRGYDETIAAFDESLEKLGLDYLDLYLVHWPNPLKHRANWKAANAESWRAIEKLYADKRVRAIGVSNFMLHHMDALLETAKVVPMANQIMLHPGAMQDDVVKQCEGKNILIQAYSPIGQGSMYECVPVIEMAKRYNKTVAQLCIRFSLQKGWQPLPKTQTISRIAENANVFDFEISDADMSALSAMNDFAGSIQNPDTAGF
ncbi:MAG: aldo/keto reductase [Oscillospiraceae bacterium]|nr:aldo/keto reductase [Oscillospiraceae bacterium]